MLFKVNGVCRLAQDPELRYLPSGSAMAKLNLVNSNKYKTKAGEDKEDTCFIEGVLFGKAAEIVSQYLKKGSKVYIDGDLKLETWQDNNGQKRSKHTLKINSFEFLDGKPQGQQPQQKQYAPPKVEVQYPDDDMSNEIPF